MATLNRNQIIGAASSLFVLPSFILTVVPTFARDPGMAVCMAFGVAGLPFIPFALRRCKDAGAMALSIVLGAVLLGYNFTNALDALNRMHAIDTSNARDRITLAASLKEKISALDARKKDVGPYKTVREAEVIDAQRAKEAECKTGHGQKCRGLTDALLIAQRDRAATERAEKIEHDLDQAQADLRAMKDVEKTADPTADQIARFAGLFWTQAATGGDAISTNRPIFKAFVVEFMGGMMPWIMVSIFGTAAMTGAERMRKHRAKRDGAQRPRDGRAAKRDERVTAGENAQKALDDREVREDNVVALPSLPKKKRKRRSTESG